MEVPTFMKIAKCSFMTPAELWFDKLWMQHDFRGLPCNANLELEDTFRRVTTLRLSTYCELEAQRFAIVTVSPSKGAMRPAMVLPIDR
jgi:hypothetical protein